MGPSVIKYARLAGQSAVDKKGMDVIILDVRKKTSVTQFFVFAGANSPVHVETLENSVRSALRLVGLNLLRADGKRGHQWRALDYGSLIVHIMERKTREFYGLERLWREGKEVPLLLKKKRKPARKKAKK